MRSVRSPFTSICLTVIFYVMTVFMIVVMIRDGFTGSGAIATLLMFMGGSYWHKIWNQHRANKNNKEQQ